LRSASAATSSTPSSRSGSRAPARVTDEQNEQFYQYIAHAYDKPRFTFRYQTDSPLHIRALFYVGGSHGEKFGMNRLEPGVSLFSRKVLIQAKAPGLLPEWLRFIKGVVDSDDVPLNIGREHLQDSALVRRLNSILTKRLLRFLADEAKKDAVARTTASSTSLATFSRRARAPTTRGAPRSPSCSASARRSRRRRQHVSLDDYVARMPERVSRRSTIWWRRRASWRSTSPYFEAFKDKNVEVLFLQLAARRVRDQSPRRLRRRSRSARSRAASRSPRSRSSSPTRRPPTRTPTRAATPEEGRRRHRRRRAASHGGAERRARAQAVRVDARHVSAGKLAAVKTTTRLSNSPAIVVDHQSAVFAA
jgi:hypothetical protein